MALSDQNRTLKKNHEAWQRPSTGHGFLLDYCLPHYQVWSSAIVFPSSFMRNFRTVFTWPIYQNLDQRIWFTFFFFISKRVALCSKHCLFFVTLWLILSQLELSRTELPKFTPSILMENCDHTICPVLWILFYMT